MKKLISLLLTFTMLLSLCACGDSQTNSTDNETAETENNIIIQPDNIEIKTSPDKYTWYVKNYVGKNLASVGYTSMGGDRMDSYGNGYIQLVLLTTNGEYVDIENEEELKNWRVIGQNLAPNTEIKYIYEVDSDGEEYDSLIAHQNIEEIVLAIAPVGTNADVPTLTVINPSPDRYTAYIDDYVGRTLSQCGYISLAGWLMDQYGNAYVHLAVYSNDGSFIDVNDESTLKNYVVTSQSISPNTEFKMTYCLDSDGNEYDSLVDTQNIEEIELYVSLVNSYVEEKPEPSIEPTSSESVSGTEDGIRPEFKAAMDSYEEFFDEYIEFIKEYESAEPTEMLEMLTDYTEYMTDFAEAMEALEEMEDDEMSTEEALYYAEVSSRITQKLLTIE